MAADWKTGWAKALGNIPIIREAVLLTAHPKPPSKSKDH
jgi:hypothetical protein